MLCLQKKLKAVSANGYWECVEMWCQCSRRGLMLVLSVLAALLRLLLWFLRVIRTTELYDWESIACWIEDQKISYCSGWKRSPRPSKAMGCSDTSKAHTGGFPFLLKLPLLATVSSYLAAEVLCFFPLYIQLY